MHNKLNLHNDLPKTKRLHETSSPTATYADLAGDSLALV
jgi:hypothetical protein